MKPVPAEGEPDGLILFDGVCVFCSRWVRFVMERDKAGLFRFLPIQSARGRALAARLGLDPENPPSHAVVFDGRAFFKSQAGLAVLSRLPGWGWTRVLGAGPRPLLDWAYDRVAANRYRLFGRTDECMAPTANERERFLS